MKLVSESGVGTVAAGVAKAHADNILISGFEGGTGASPLSSIKHAGLPWEIGLAETHETLVMNDLRGRVRLQTDGQLKTGRDVVIAAMLGAEEFGFATPPLIVLGCVMMRRCHQNTCPVGVATQDPEFTQALHWRTRHVINFFFFVAEECASYGEAGNPHFRQAGGPVDTLDMVRAVEHWKAKSGRPLRLLYWTPAKPGVAIYNCEHQDHHIDEALDRRAHRGGPAGTGQDSSDHIEMPIHNIDRAVGTMLSDEIATRYGDAGLPEDTITATFRGTAGHSSAHSLARGVTLETGWRRQRLFRQGLSGGRLIVGLPLEARHEPTENIIIGNTVLYGAIAGEAYIRGIAGERFAVRNRAPSPSSKAPATMAANT